MYNFHNKRKNDLTIIASTKNYEIPYGICQIDKKGKLKKIVEKPTSKIFCKYRILHNETPNS